MASGRLAATTSVAATTYNVYQVPAGKTAEVNINVYNGSGVVNKVTLFRSTSTTTTAIHTIQLDTLAVDSGYERTAVVLKAGDWISFKTDQIGTTVVVNGNEYTSKSNEIDSSVLITTNTETVVYPNSVAKAGAVNICVTMADGSALSDTAVCKLYVSSSNAAGGYPIHKYTITGNGISGFEKTGQAIKSTDKVILVTTGIVGSIVARVSGYTRG